MIGKGLLALTALLGTALATPTVRPPAASLPNPESVRHIPELAWHAAEADVECGTVCWDQIASGVHVAVCDPEYATNETGLGCHPAYYSGSCAVKHPPCGGGLLSALEGVQVALERRDVQGLKAGLVRGGAKAYFAAERNAVQIVGCKGEVVAHLPVPTGMRMALAE